MDITFLSGPVKHLMCIRGFSLLCRRRGDELGFQLSLRDLSSMHIIFSFPAALTELIFPPNVFFSNVASLAMNELIFLQVQKFVQTSRILEFKGDSWFLHQVTHDTVQLLFLSGIKNAFKKLIEGVQKISWTSNSF